MKLNIPKDGKCWCSLHHGNQGAWLPTAEFYRVDNADEKKGYQNKCKACNTEYMREYQRKRRIKEDEQSEEYLDALKAKAEDFKDLCAEIIQNVHDSGASKVESETICAKLKLLEAECWDMM